MPEPRLLPPKRTSAQMDNSMITNNSVPDVSIAYPPVKSPTNAAWKQALCDAIHTGDRQKVGILLAGRHATVEEIREFIDQPVRHPDDGEIRKQLRKQIVESWSGSNDMKLELAVNKLEDWELVQNLLKAGADPRGISLSTRNPLITHMVQRALWTIKLYPSPVPSSGETEIDVALRNRDYPGAQSLLAERVVLHDIHAVHELWTNAERNKELDIIRALILTGHAQRHGLRLSEDSPINNAAIKHTLGQIAQLPQLDRRRYVGGAASFIAAQNHRASRASSRQPRADDQRQSLGEVSETSSERSVPCDDIGSYTSEYYYHGDQGDDAHLSYSSSPVSDSEHASSAQYADSEHSSTAPSRRTDSIHTQYSDTPAHPVRHDSNDSAATAATTTATAGATDTSATTPTKAGSGPYPSRNAGKAEDPLTDEAMERPRLGNASVHASSTDDERPGFLAGGLKVQDVNAQRTLRISKRLGITRIASWKAMIEDTRANASRQDAIDYADGTASRASGAESRRTAPEGNTQGLRHLHQPRRDPAVHAESRIGNHRPQAMATAHDMEAALAAALKAGDAMQVRELGWQMHRIADSRRREQIVLNAARQLEQMPNVGGRHAISEFSRLLSHISSDRKLQGEVAAILNEAGDRAPLLSRHPISRLNAALRAGDIASVRAGLHRLQDFRQPLPNDDVMRILTALPHAIWNGHSEAIDAVQPLLRQVGQLPDYANLLASAVDGLNQSRQDSIGNTLQVLVKLLNGLPADGKARVLFRAAGLLRHAFERRDSEAITAVTNLINQHATSLNQGRKADLLDLILRQQRTRSWPGAWKSSSYKTWRNAERDADSHLYTDYRMMKQRLMGQA